jgi:NAD(P)H dehydrogenase (quinone)
MAHKVKGHRMTKRQKHVLVVSHPNPNSFNLAIAHAYQKAAEDLGQEVVLRDLYRCGFDPCLKDAEIPRAEGFAPEQDIVTERALLADATAFAFVYPLWFNAPPAMIVGYVQRVFGMGFGFGPVRDGRNQPLLLGRRMLSFTTSGAPAEWLRTEGSWDALRNLFDRHVADVCGLTVLDHKHYGRIVAHSARARLETHLQDVAQTVTRYFADAR